MIDLHSHTDQSDGTSTPELLVEQAVSAGLRALAITDHDTLAGHDLAVPFAEAAKLELICGIELSTRLPSPAGSNQRSPSVHLLGYFAGGPPSATFRDWLGSLQESRRQRNLRLIDKLQTLGVAITLEEVQQVGKHLTGRPHFAQVLLRKGVVSTMQEAFDRYLADHAQAAVEREEPTLVEGIHRILEGNGLPSLAHPVRLVRDDASYLPKLLDILASEGLRGIEVFHSEHDPAHTHLFAREAERLKLIPTGGSDYHGSNKPGIALGSGRGNLRLPYSILEAMRQSSAAAARFVV